MKASIQPHGERGWKWEEAPYRLEMEQAGSVGYRDYITYRFYCDGTLIFEGSDFSPSPMHGLDSPESTGALLSFLSLQPGDTDAEYFEHYTEEQMAFAEEHGEDLSYTATLLEEEGQER